MSDRPRHFWCRVSDQGAEGCPPLQKVDDLIVTSGGQTPYAVLSVGGFLGLGTKYVVLPFTSLKIVDKKLSCPAGPRML